LTTFIDHRLHPGRMNTYERPTMGQIISDGLLLAHVRPAATTIKSDRIRRSRPSYRQKGARRSSGQDRKDQGIHGGFKSMNTQIQAGRSQSIETCTRRGIPATQASQNLLLNLYSLVKEHRKEPVKAPYKGA